MANFENYDYYVHGTQLTGDEFCYTVFHEGLRSKYGCSVHSTMALLDSSVDLDTQIKNYAENHKGTVFVFKVPKRFGVEGGNLIAHRDGSIGFQHCKPVWKAEPNQKYSYFTPHLIVGSYDYKTQKFISNREYDENYNPNGLQYSKELETALQVNGRGEYEEIVERRKMDFKTLQSQDIRTERFVKNAFDIVIVRPTLLDKYNFPFILLKPKHPSKDIKIFVEGNNSVDYIKEDKKTTQTFEEQEIDAIRYAENLCPIDNGLNFNPSYLYQNLNQPIIIPIIERCDNKFQYEFYTQMLGRNVMLEKKGKFAHLSTQVVKMVEKVKKMYEKEGYKVEDKAGLVGMSASGVFAGRMAFAEPESFDTCLSVCSNAVQPLPVKSLNGVELPYPLGTADYKKIFGKEFNLDAYSQIQQLFIVGEMEDNTRYDISQNSRLHDKATQDLYRQVYGNVTIQERQHRINHLMEKMGMNQVECIVANGGHTWRNKGRVVTEKWLNPLLQSQQQETVDLRVKK